jgi:translation initiation factor 3 subunit C
VVTKAKETGMQFNFDSSSEEESKRVVRSAKDKRWDQLQQTIKAMRNHMKINDWCSITKDYEALGKGLDKAKNVIKAEGGVPAFFYKAVLLVEQKMKTAFADKVCVINARCGCMLCVWLYVWWVC